MAASYNRSRIHNYIRHHPGSYAAEIATAVFISASNVSRHCAELVKQGELRAEACAAPTGQAVTRFWALS